MLDFLFLDTTLLSYHLFIYCVYGMYFLSTFSTFP